MTVLYERITYTAALRAETESLFWLDELREGAAKGLRGVINATPTGRQAQLEDHQALCLQAAARAWGGKEKPRQN